MPSPRSGRSRASPARRNVSVSPPASATPTSCAVLRQIIANPGGAGPRRRRAGTGSTATRPPAIPPAWNGPNQSVTHRQQRRHHRHAARRGRPARPRAARAVPQLHRRRPAPAARVRGRRRLRHRRPQPVDQPRRRRRSARRWPPPAATRYQVATVSPQCVGRGAVAQLRPGLAGDVRQRPAGAGYPNPNNRGRDADRRLRAGQRARLPRHARGSPARLVPARHQFPGIVTPADYAGRFTPGVPAAGALRQLRRHPAARSPLPLRDVIPGHTPHQILARVRDAGRADPSSRWSSTRAGRIAGIAITGRPAGTRTTPSQQRPLATSWSQIDARLAALAPVRGLIGREVGPNGCPRCTASTPASVGPVGSVFKTFILGELADQVRAGAGIVGRALPGAGPRPGHPTPRRRTDRHPLSLRTYAADMIWMSDNTATDHLLFRLGRSNVEAQQAAFGTANPAANIPFPSAREAFVLKYVNDPVLRNQYLALNPTAGGRSSTARSSTSRRLNGGAAARGPSTPSSGSSHPATYAVRSQVSTNRPANPALAPIADIMAITESASGCHRRTGARRGTRAAPKAACSPSPSSPKPPTAGSSPSPPWSPTHPLFDDPPSCARCGPRPQLLRPRRRHRTMTSRTLPRPPTDQTRRADGRGRSRVVVGRPVC